MKFSIIVPIYNVEEYIDKYIAYCEKINSSPSTIRGYESIKRNLSEEFLDLRFSDLTNTDIQRELNRYGEILERNGLEWGESMSAADVSTLDAQCVMALLVGAVRAERFCDGVLLGFFRDGSIQKWLTRLKEIDGGTV